jgi:hypothetical protein
MRHIGDALFADLCLFAVIFLSAIAVFAVETIRAAKHPIQAPLDEKDRDRSVEAGIHARVPRRPAQLLVAVHRHLSSLIRSPAEESPRSDSPPPFAHSGHARNTPVPRIDK